MSLSTLSNQLHCLSLPLLSPTKINIQERPRYNLPGITGNRHVDPKESSVC